VKQTQHEGQTMDNTQGRLCTCCRCRRRCRSRSAAHRVPLCCATVLLRPALLLASLASLAAAADPTHWRFIIHAVLVVLLVVLRPGAAAAPTGSPCSPPLPLAVPPCSPLACPALLLVSAALRHSRAWGEWFIS